MTLRDWFLALSPRQQTFAILVPLAIVALLALSLVGYINASATRSAVLEHNKTLAADTELWRSKAAAAERQAGTYLREAVALEEKLNAKQKEIERVQARVGELEAGSGQARVIYRGARRLSDRELAELRARLGLLAGEK